MELLDVDHPAEMPPLYETVDLDALDRLFTTANPHDGANAAVSFTFGGYRITVSESGRGYIAPASDRESETLAADA